MGFNVIDDTGKLCRPWHRLRDYENVLFTVLSKENDGSIGYVMAKDTANSLLETFYKSWRNKNLFKQYLLDLFKKEKDHYKNF